MYDQHNDGGFTARDDGSQSFTEHKTDKSVRSVTIRSLHNVKPSSTDSMDAFLDGRPINHFKLVARVETLRESEVSYQFDLHDGTGSLNTRYFTTSNQTGDEAFEDEDRKRALKKEPLQHKQYYTLFGRVAIKNDKPSFYVMNYEKMRDYNELLYHQLDALAQHLYWTRGPPEKGSAPADDDIFVSRDHGSGINDVSSRILGFLKQKSELTDGVAIQDIARAVGKDVNVVKSVLEQLLDAGSIIQHSDDHYGVF